MSQAGKLFSVITMMMVSPSWRFRRVVLLPCNSGITKSWRTNRQLARLLMEKSYREGDFTLASGKKSNYYFDCRVTSLTAEGAYLIGELFNDLVGSNVVGVAGMTMGADPLVTATSLASRNTIAQRGNVLNALYVRKEPKDHGMGKQVEGVENFDLKSERGRRIAVLEDVVTTGGSLLKACDALEKCGFEIVKCCAILDREEEGREKIMERYPFFSLFTVETLKRLGS